MLRCCADDAQGVLGVGVDGRRSVADDRHDEPGGEESSRRPRSDRLVFDCLNGEAARVLAAHFYCDVGFLEVVIVCGEDVHKFVGVTVNKGEPARLNLDHDAVPFFEGVAGIGEGERDAFDFIGIHGLGVLVATSEFGAHDFSPDEHVKIGIFWFGSGEDIDEFGDEVAIGAGDLGEDLGFDVSGDGEVLGEWFGREGEDIGPGDGKLLIIEHVFA